MILEGGLEMDVESNVDELGSVLKFHFLQKLSALDQN